MPILTVIATGQAGKASVPVENMLLFDTESELWLCGDGIHSIFELLAIKQSGSTLCEHTQAQAKAALEVAVLKSEPEEKKKRGRPKKKDE